MNLFINSCSGYPLYYFFDSADHISAGWATQMQLPLWSSIYQSAHTEPKEESGSSSRAAASVAGILYVQVNLD